jgi:UDP-GlcNAc:undecaprenyl-phosphate GlcNAc-1-phosphate transferase
MFLVIASLAFGVACLSALALTPIAARLAERCGVVDNPDGNRKAQTRSTALGGGVVVLTAMTAALVTMQALGASIDGLDSRVWLYGFVPAAIVLFLVGVVDDTRGLTGIYKLIGQVLASTLLVAGGFRFDILSLLGLPIHLGDFSIPFTIFFCLGAINAFNLIDGSDALASSVGGVIAVTLGVISAAQGNTLDAIVCFSLAGALAGFLPYNAPPARIYLGDTGSMMIGLIVAAVAVHSSIKRQAAFALAVPIAVCAIPILDSLAALVRRVTTGQSVFTPDRGHLHHALLHRGWSAGKTAFFVAALTAVTCGGALASFFTKQEAYAVIAVVGVFALLAATRVFGHSEVKLLATHASSAISSRFRSKRRVIEKSIQIHGRRRWEMIWTALREAAPRHGVVSMKMTVNIPRLHESFYASWKQSEERTGEDGWRMALPLALEGREIGMLHMEGASLGSSAIPEMQEVLEFLEPLEEQLRRLAQDIEEGAEGALPPSVPEASLVLEEGILPPADDAVGSPVTLGAK